MCAFAGLVNRDGNCAHRERETGSEGMLAYIISGTVFLSFMFDDKAAVEAAELAPETLAHFSQQYNLTEGKKLSRAEAIAACALAKMAVGSLPVLFRVATVHTKDNGLARVFGYLEKE